MDLIGILKAEGLAISNLSKMDPIADRY